MQFECDKIYGNVFMVWRLTMCDEIIRIVEFERKHFWDRYENLPIH
jgi:hypothetical protein